MRPRLAASSPFSQRKYARVYTCSPKSPSLATNTAYTEPHHHAILIGEHFLQRDQRLGVAFGRTQFRIDYAPPLTRLLENDRDQDCESISRNAQADAYFRLT